MSYDFSLLDQNTTSSCNYLGVWRRTRKTLTAVVPNLRVGAPTSRMNWRGHVRISWVGNFKKLFSVFCIICCVCCVGRMISNMFESIYTVQVQFEQSTFFILIYCECIWSESFRLRKHVPLWFGNCITSQVSLTGFGWSVPRYLQGGCIVICVCP